MKLIINKDRSVIPVGTWGTVNENDYEILDFEFPAELEEYNKRIVYYLGDERVWDTIVNNKAYITNAITTKGDVKAYVWCTKENTEREADTDFRTMLFEMHFFENENADGIVPTEEQVDGFNTMLTAMNAKIDEVDALEQTIETAEAQRQEAEATRVSNENTRESNESTRQTNEQTRQTQEAERERKTAEAIADIKNKTAEYNANAEAKTTAFNNNATQKTNDFNTNASSKTSAFNSNAETKTNTFNTNATNKTNAFNSNATEKTTTFNNNASTKTSEFNTNAESKTTDFNTNATSKTNDFNDNATEKTTAFNQNAQEKIDEYDEHIVEYQAQIDELQEEVEELSENMPWNTTEQATEISVDDAAKYSKNKLELFGNTRQDSYQGYNLCQTVHESTSKNGLTFVVNNDGSITVNGTSTAQTIFPITNNGINIAKIIPYSANTTYNISFGFTGSDSTYFVQIINLTEDGTTNQYTSIFSSYNFSKAFDTLFGIGIIIRAGQTLDNVTFKPMIIEGSYTTDTLPPFEPYVGGVPSPNPDYPQPIHVVTGNNTIGVQGKNLFNKNNYNIKSLSTAVNTAGGTGTYTAATNQKHIYIPCKPSTDYVVIKDVSNISVLGIYETATEPALNVSYTCLYFSSNSDGKRHITTSTNAQYLDIRINTNAITQNEIDTIVSTLIIAEGIDTNISYVPYYHADYPINLGSLELCKIGNYQDYLYKENGNWYIQKNTGKTILGKPTTGNLNTNYAYNYFSYRGEPAGIYPGIDIICSHFIGAYNIADMRNKAQYNNSVYWGSNSVFVRVDKFNTVEEYINALSANDITIIGRARTPTTTQITDETLIAQLDAIYNHLALVKGTNNITVTASDLAPYMELSYMQDLKSKLDNLDSRLALLE